MSPPGEDGLALLSDLGRRGSIRAAARRDGRLFRRSVKSLAYQVVLRGLHRAIRPEKNGLSVGVVMPRRLREYDRPRARQRGRRDPVKLSVLPLPDPPCLFVQIILQLDRAEEGVERPGL